MIQRYKIGGIAALCILAQACGGTATETAESCVQRFEGSLSADPDFGATLFQPVFTYDVTHVKDVFETFSGEGADLAGMQVTATNEATDEALRTFYAAEVPAKGRIFAADGLTLIRVHGMQGTSSQIILAGCERSPAKARLLNIKWNEPSDQADGLTEPQ